jgi:hypothetical protein
MKHPRTALAALLFLAQAAPAQNGPTFDSNPFVPLPFPLLPSARPQPDRQMPRGPWQNDLLVYRVASDGETALAHTFERGGVPTMARLKDGRIIAAFQHFPEDDERHFDRIAASLSADEGTTWSKPQPISVEGMEAGLMRPFDPTLLPLPDGRIRLYFTSNRSRRFEESTPAIYSAISEDGIHYQFEPGVRFAIEGRVVIDCAVCLHKGTFHLIVPDNGTPAEMQREQQGRQPPRGGTGYHAVSKDGLNFERMDDVQLDGDLRWLGNMQSDGTAITFVGTGHRNPTASSTDGVKWTPVEFPKVRGADPGGVKLHDGSWLMITTSESRR